MQRSVFLLISTCNVAFGRVFQPLELSQELKDLGVSEWDIPLLVCRAHQVSDLRTDFNHTQDDARDNTYGIFGLKVGLPILHTLDRPRCALTIAKLTDDDIGDDVRFLLDVPSRSKAEGAMSKGHATAMLLDLHGPEFIVDCIYWWSTLPPTLYHVNRRLYITNYTTEMGANNNLGEALQFLREYDNEASSMCTRVTEAQWHYVTNITDQNKKRMADALSLQAKLDRVSWQKAIQFGWSSLPDPMARRQLQMLALKGRTALPQEKQDELTRIVAEMKEIFNRARVCPFSNSGSSQCDLSLEPELTRVMAHSRSYEEQLHAWKSWRDATGPKLRSRFSRYVELANEAARLNGFRDAGEQERAAYGVDDFRSQISEVWSTLAPLYRQLHAYVRSRLRRHYAPPHRINPTAPIPAQLLGNMWAQNWKNILDLVLPYPGKRRADVTSEMLRQGYTPQRMIQIGEEFFTSMGLKPMPVEFWHKSLLERPTNRHVACKASAWDFCNRRDYRIKQCTDVAMDDLLTTHHEMTHIQYYLHYSDLPYVFRDGANPAFHEALADAILLSVTTPKHLHRIGLLNNITDDYETDINFLLEMALDKVAYLPFAFIVDQWRWQMFSEGTRNMNTAWWELRSYHQGVIPPLARSEDDFDPGSKYHIISDQPYIRYFISLVLQFQIHQALCTAAGHVGTLHTCDIYRSREAGRVLADIMAVGASRPWTEILRVATKGSASGLDARPMLEYFKPLSLWLRVQNRDEPMIGWVTTEQDSALYEQWARGSSSHLDFHLITWTCLLIAASLAAFSS